MKPHRQDTNLLDEVLHFILKAPPLEFDGDQLVGTHVWAVFLAGELLLQGHEKQGPKQTLASANSI